MAQCRGRRLFQGIGDCGVRPTRHRVAGVVAGGITRSTPGDDAQNQGDVEGGVAAWACWAQVVLVAVHATDASVDAVVQAAGANVGDDVQAAGARVIGLVAGETSFSAPGSGAEGQDDA